MKYYLGKDEYTIVFSMPEINRLEKLGIVKKHNDSKTSKSTYYVDECKVELVTDGNKIYEYREYYKDGSFFPYISRREVIGYEYNKLKPYINKIKHY